MSEIIKVDAKAVDQQRRRFKSDDFGSNRVRQRSGESDLISVRTNPQSMVHSPIPDDDTLMSVGAQNIYHPLYRQQDPAMIPGISQSSPLPSMPPDLLESVSTTMLPSPLRASSVNSASPSSSPQSHESNGRPRLHNSLSEASQEAANLEVRDWLQTLGTNRGTGIYTCPHHLSCDKGGVKDGEMVQFTRNSAFKSVEPKLFLLFFCWENFRVVYLLKSWC
jgi:hypothetical protein